MNIKQFLQPNKRKNIVFIILFTLTNLLILLLAISITGGDFGYFEIIGLPIGFIRLEVCSATITGVQCGGGFFSLLYLIIDIVFWYLIACFIVHIYNKIKRVKKK